MMTVYMIEEENLTFGEPNPNGSTNAEREVLEDEELLPGVQ